MTKVDSLAQVAKTAELASDVVVEANAFVGADCRIGRGTVIGRNSIVWENTIIGDYNRIFPFCSLGGEPQDKKCRGEGCTLTIGNNNTIREYCFINKGTRESGKTLIGHDNWIMAYVHVAHDCVLKNNLVLANGVQLAGHVKIDEGAILSGGVLCHQFRCLGKGVMIGGNEKILHDVPPYALVAKDTVGVNIEGMRRQGFDIFSRNQVQAVYRLLYRRNLSLTMAIQEIKSLPKDNPAISAIIEFLQRPKLKLIRPKNKQ